MGPDFWGTYRRSRRQTLQQLLNIGDLAIQLPNFIPKMLWFRGP
jgi:hypothetical protein